MRVRLETPSLEREREFVAAARRSRRLHGRWVAAPATPASYRAFVKRTEDPTRQAHFVGVRDSGALVGVINLSEIVRGALCSAYLGCYGFMPHAGQGLMREGLCLVLRRAFGELQLHRVEANIQPGNERSLALFRRSGFRREGYSPRYLKIAGRWRDHERWAMLAEEWRALGRAPSDARPPPAGGPAGSGAGQAPRARPPR